MDGPDVVRPWSIKTRMLEHRQLQATKQKAEAEQKKSRDKLFESSGVKAKPRRTGFDPLPADPSERVLQKNEGEWKFRLDESEDGKSLVLEVPVGKFMDTSLIDVDVQPLLVRALVKVRRRRAHALSDMSACMHARAPGLR